jgi:gluconolactonase
MKHQTATFAGYFVPLLFVVRLLSADFCAAQHSVTGQVEKVAGGFQFLEGPVWRDGTGLLFSDINGNTVYRWRPDSGTTVFLSPSGKANGLTYDQQGRLLMAKQGDRVVTRLEPDGTQTVLASAYNGKKLNSPNDLVVHSDGSIWFTDPPYGILPSPGELGFSGIYRVSPSGTLSLLDASLARPNGIAFVPDQTKLYVGDAETRRIYIWDVHDSTISNKRQFAFMNATGYTDGMKVDPEGNLYATGPYGVWVYAPDGTFLDTIAVPGQTTNCNWGDGDRRTLYITSGQALYRVRPVITALGSHPNPPPAPASPTIEYNYPNPAISSTTIFFTVPVAGHVSLRIVDILGRVVMTQVNEDRTMGLYQEQIELSGFAAGIYFCQLLTAGGSATRKMLVIK